MDIVRFVINVDWDRDGVMDDSRTIYNARGGSVWFELKRPDGVYQVHAELPCGGNDDHGLCCHWDYPF